MNTYPPTTFTEEKEPQGKGEPILQPSGHIGVGFQESFDQIAGIAGKVLNTKVALVSLVDQDQQVFRGQAGLQEPFSKTRQTPLTHSFCKHVAINKSPLVVADATRHPLVCDNPAVKEMDVKAYLGTPLVTSEGRVLGSFCVIEDVPREWTDEDLSLLQQISDMVITKIEAQLLARKMQENYVNLREEELMKEELINMLVHDMRSPLSAIVGGADLLSMAPDNMSDVSKYTELITMGAEKLRNMVDDILDVKQSELEELHLDMVETPIDDLLNKVCLMMQGMAEPKGIKLIYNRGSGVVVNCDRTRLERVLENLISNSIKNTNKGGRIWIKLKLLSESHIEIEIKDTGIGIPEALFSKIFEPFSQEERHKCSRKSSGLGLSFCKSIVEEHGGEILLESEVGSGTSFRVVLPRNRAKVA